MRIYETTRDPRFFPSYYKSINDLKGIWQLLDFNRNLGKVWYRENTPNQFKQENVFLVKLNNKFNEFEKKFSTLIQEKYMEIKTSQDKMLQTPGSPQHNYADIIISFRLTIVKAYNLVLKFTDDRTEDIKKEEIKPHSDDFKQLLGFLKSEYAKAEDRLKASLTYSATHLIDHRFAILSTQSFNIFRMYTIPYTQNGDPLLHLLGLGEGACQGLTLQWLVEKNTNDIVPIPKSYIGTLKKQHDINMHQEFWRKQQGERKEKSLAQVAEWLLSEDLDTQDCKPIRLYLMQKETGKGHLIGIKKDKHGNLILFESNYGKFFTQDSQIFKLWFCYFCLHHLLKKNTPYTGHVYIARGHGVPLRPTLEDNTFPSGESSIFDYAMHKAIIDDIISNIKFTPTFSYDNSSKLINHIPADQLVNVKLLLKLFFKQAISMTADEQQLDKLKDIIKNNDVLMIQRKPGVDKFLFRSSTSHKPKTITSLLDEIENRRKTMSGANQRILGVF